MSSSLLITQRNLPRSLSLVSKTSKVAVITPSNSSSPLRFDFNSAAESIRCGVTSRPASKLVLKLNGVQIEGEAKQERADLGGDTTGCVIRFNLICSPLIFYHGG